MSSKLIVLFVVIFFIVAAFSALKVKPVRRVSKYRRAPLMTPNEIEFFNRLNRALPDFHVFPQVAMAALIAPVDSFKSNRAAYWQINQKRFDYAVYTKSMGLVCIVELDDRMHDATKDKERDLLTRSAGI